MSDSEKNPSDLKQHICFNFYSGWRQITEYYRRYLPDGVSLQQQYILEMCDIKLGLQVKQIAMNLALDNPAVSGLLRRMEQSDLIQRVVKPENRRETLVFLTAAGLKLKKALRRDMARSEKELNESISKEELNSLIKINDKVRLMLQKRSE